MGHVANISNFIQLNAIILLALTFLINFSLIFEAISEICRDMVLLDNVTTSHCFAALSLKTEFTTSLAAGSSKDSPIV
jgi:hypothetical protein